MAEPAVNHPTLIVVKLRAAVHNQGSPSVRNSHRVLSRKWVRLTPVEPSEAVQTLELGIVNAGFIFFPPSSALRFFGRFVCG
ncbi:MAG: hypothetical protein M1G31_06500 [Pseudanabaena sp. Salubria-1]|nr:hypothetical protein [Pseudanabaena sp. Salubria-1]